MSSQQTISVNSYIPPYIAPDLKWYKRDGLLTYIDRLKYERFEKDRDAYLKNARIINFDIIHHESRGDELQNSYKHYKTVGEKNFDKMPKNGRKKATAACFRSKRKDLYVQRDIMLAYFKTL